MADEPTMRAARSAGHPLLVALGLLRADAPEQIMSVAGGMAELGGAAAARADRSWPSRWWRHWPAWPDAMADASWLLDRAGTYLQVHARFTDAQVLLERALAIDEAAYGPDHPDVAAALNNLSLILRDLGQLEVARPLQERALAITQGAQSAGPELIGGEGGS